MNITDVLRMGYRRKKGQRHSIYISYMRILPPREIAHVFEFLFAPSVVRFSELIDKPIIAPDLRRTATKTRSLRTGECIYGPKCFNGQSESPITENH